MSYESELAAITNDGEASEEVVTQIKAAFPTMVSDYETVKIENKTVVIGNIGKLVKGESLSDIITFSIPRFANGIDLIDKTIVFLYQLPNDHRVYHAYASNSSYTTDTLIFSWVLEPHVLSAAGTVTAAIHFIGTAENGEEYSTRTLPFTFEPLYTLEGTDIPVTASTDWFTSMEARMNAAEKKVEEGTNGVSDYTNIKNKPSINSVSLEGNKTSAELGLAASTHSHSNYTTAEVVDEKISVAKEEVTAAVDEKIAPTALEKPTVLLIFDNGAYDNRAELLKSYGFHATFAFNIGNIMDDVLLGLKNLIAEGHDIAMYAGVGTMPTEYSTESAAEAWLTYLTAGVERLKTAGYYLPTQYGCPQHKGSKTIYDACEALGIKYVSCTYKLVNGESWSTDDSIEYNSVATNSPFKMGMCPQIISETFETNKGYIDTAIANKQLLPLFTHNVIETGTSNHASITAYTEMLDYLKALYDDGKVEVLTMRELYNKYHEEDGKNRDYTRMMAAAMIGTTITTA